VLTTVVFTFLLALNRNESSYNVRFMYMFGDKYMSHFKLMSDS